MKETNFTDNKKHKTAFFAAGCFWGIEEAFRTTPGVVDTEVGYSGGTTKEPTYKQVCSGNTGHAETVRVTYDPGQISYEDLLEKFWQMHDPTQINRQGPDVGEQYRSSIFYLNEEQKRLAEKSLKEQEEKRDKQVATEIKSAKDFWRAEEYHQNYEQKQKRRQG